MTWRRPALVGATAVVVATMALGSPAAAQNSGLTGGAQVARTYNAIMNAQFEDVPALLAATCPPAPADVCPLLSLVSLWWQIQQDPLDRSHDAAFARDADAVIERMEQWTERQPARAEAWFYLGGAIGARAQWRVLRGQTVSAARDGKRIKSSLERALMLDPALHDAYFGIGMYHYYADVAPAFAKMLRWLLLLPGGDRERGLEEMLRARSGGQLLRSEADYQLHQIYRWYEKQTPQALDLLATLAARHPNNPHFAQQIAEIEDYSEDHVASLAAWERLLTKARAGAVAYADLTLVRAQLGIALELDHLGQREAAIQHLQAVIDGNPNAPVGATALAHLQLGSIYDRLGRRNEATAAYRAALMHNPKGDPLKVDARARAGLRSLAR